jgi:hypothetical protein
MANVHGIEFNANQSELVKDIVRDLLKDGNCAVYAVPHIKPNGELRMASASPIPGPRRQHGVFLRIRPGVSEATGVVIAGYDRGGLSLPVWVPQRL